MKPSRREPVMLMSRVCTGKVVPARSCTQPPRRERNTPPTALPRATYQIMGTPSRQNVRRSHQLRPQRFEVNSITWSKDRPEHSAPARPGQLTRAPWRCIVHLPPVEGSTLPMLAVLLAAAAAQGPGPLTLTLDDALERARAGRGRAPAPARSEGHK